MFFVAMICDFAIAVVDFWMAIQMFNSQRWFLASLYLGLAVMLFCLSFKLLCRIMKGEKE